MFAEFELLLHQAQESEKALTADFFSQEYANLNRFYYGKDVIIDDEISLEWARIPHFFYHYYVYQYATGFAVALLFPGRYSREAHLQQKNILIFLHGEAQITPFLS